MKNRFQYLLTVCCFFSAGILASTPIGQWETHLSYLNSNQVVTTDKEVYAASAGSLFSVDLNDSSLSTYTTLDGMNGQDIVKMGWSATAKTLVLVYSNGSIDLKTDRNFVGLSDFKNAPITADKTILGLRVFGNTALISTGSGLLVVDLIKKVFSNAYFNSFGTPYTPCQDAVMWSDSLMVVHTLGFYVANRSDNLQDAAYWAFMGNLPSTQAKQLIRFQNRFFALGADGIVYSGYPHQWTVFLNRSGITSISVQDDRMLIAATNESLVFDSNLNSIPVQAGNTKAIAWDKTSNTLYRASGNAGLAKLVWNNASYTESSDSIMPIGPPVNTSWNAFFLDGTYYSTSGRRWTDRFFYNGDVSIYDGEEWSSLPDKEILHQTMGFMPQDFINLAVDPTDKSHYFITSWGDGLIEYRNNRFYKWHNPSNSPINTIYPGRYSRLDGAVFDKEGNLWVLNSKYKTITGAIADSSLLILKPNGTWLKPRYNSMKACPTWNSILFTSNNQAWMNAVRFRTGIFVLDNKGTLENTADDSYKAFDNFVDQDGLIYTPWYILCMTEDKNGTIWIGTDIGPFLASGTENVFKSDYTFTRVKVPKNDGTLSADYLLNNIQINCIAVDGANRKWIGTQGQGVYLLSADGLSTIHHFETGNAPLPSNVIWSIAIHPTTGEVFIGTEKGLVTYRSDATEGTPDYSSVHVFPNPVKPGYNGLITVTGLKEGTQIRISDINGNTLIRGKSLGGQFSWNGITRNGNRASSGVYLVFCASEDGVESQACKFMIVR